MSLSGRLLIASRTLRDPNFLRTVVLMLEHGDEGALGVVLNRPTDRTLTEVWDAIDADPIANEKTLWRGGPVPGPLIGLHRSEPLGEKQVLPGLFMSMQRDSLDELVRQDEHAYRIYTGNSGWGGGQLEGEIKVGGWLTGDARPADLFADPEDLWPAVTKRIGLSIMLPGVEPEDLPPDANLN
ncbi:MAG: YqgE/AlgH family protein [Planctomycetota bacterium]